MAVALVQAGNGVHNTFTTATATLTPTFATAPSASSVCLLIIECDFANTSGNSVATPSGWTLAYSRSDNTTADQTYVYWRTGFTATSQAIVASQTAGSTSYSAAVLLEYSGVSTTSPFNAEADADEVITVAPETISFAPVTPTITGGYALFICGANDRGYSLNGSTVQTGWVADFNLIANMTDYALVYVSHQTATTTSGTAVTPTLDCQNASYISPNYQGFSIVLAPPAAGSVVLPPNYDGGMARYAGGMAA